MESNTHNNISPEFRSKRASQITITGFFLNIVIAVFKMIAGIVGNSSAMIADGIHSASDSVTDVVVLISFQISKRPADNNHNYGHGKFETLASVIIGISLSLVGFGVLYSGVENIYYVLVLKNTLVSPKIIAVIAAIISIFVKEFLFRYTIAVAKNINSNALVGNAWHHRTDAYSSVGTLIGISGAMLLGENWRILDPITAVIVSFFILKTGFWITLESIKELLEESLDEKTESDIISTIDDVDDVIDPHNLKTRKLGNNMSIDIDIRVKNSLNVVEAHNINNNVEKKIKEKFGDGTIINIHTEPEHE